MSFLFILKLSYSKPFHNTLNYASTANIEEVMKFYNLGHKTFETDFNFKTDRYLNNFQEHLFGILRLRKCQTSLQNFFPT